MLKLGITQLTKYYLLELKPRQNSLRQLLETLRERSVSMALILNEVKVLRLILDVSKVEYEGDAAF